MEYMFYNATAFNQNLSGWCVFNIASIPTGFSSGSALSGANHPVWGTCTSFELGSNGVTVICDDVPVGTTGLVNETAYTKRTRDQIRPENAATTCTSGITDMSYLFSGDSTFNGDISHWDTSKVTNMAYMFDSAHTFNQDISAWDTSSVENMSAMFTIADSFNQNIGTWDTSEVTNMEGMFAGATTFNQNLSGWCVSNIESDVHPAFRVVQRWLILIFRCGVAVRLRSGEVAESGAPIQRAAGVKPGSRGGVRPRIGAKALVNFFVNQSFFMDSGGLRRPRARHASDGRHPCGVQTARY